MNVHIYLKIEYGIDKATFKNFVSIVLNTFTLILFIFLFKI
jgi:hypothetical protein